MQHKQQQHLSNMVLASSNQPDFGEERMSPSKLKEKAISNIYRYGQASMYGGYKTQVGAKKGSVTVKNSPKWKGVKRMSVTAGIWDRDLIGGIVKAEVKVHEEPESTRRIYEELRNFESNNLCE